MARTMVVLSSISGVLSFLVILVGLIVVAVAYFKGKSRVALLGAIGFLILFLFSCCSMSWGFADNPITRGMRPPSQQTYWTIKYIAMFLFGLVNLAGWILIIVALWQGGKKS